MCSAAKTPAKAKQSKGRATAVGKGKTGPQGSGKKDNAAHDTLQLDEPAPQANSALSPDTAVTKTSQGIPKPCTVKHAYEADRADAAGR